MKTKTLRIFIALLILTAFLASACNEGTPPAETTAAPNGDSTAAADIVLFGGDTTYNVIRDQYASQTVLDAVKDVRRAISASCGGTWEGIITEDFEVGLTRDSIVDNNEPEILLGSTNRRESREASADLGENDYIIRAVGNKIVITGGSDRATAKAIAIFLETFFPEGTAKKITVPADLNISGEAPLQEVSVNSEAKYRLMTWNLGCAVGVAADAVDVITKYLPDIVALQECNASIQKNVIDALPEFYEVATRYHAGTSTYVYTPILYNSKLFTLRDSGVEWLRDRYTGTNTKCAAWAVFEDADGNIFADVNFHGAVCSASYKGFEDMTSAERSAQAKTWREGNARQVLEIIGRIEDKFGNIPIMVNGDCNFTSSSTAYSIITSAGLTDSELTARLGRVTGYQTYFSYGTGIKSGLSIDHIFGRNAIDFVEHYIVRDSNVLTASDHCPVYVDFNP